MLNSTLKLNPKMFDRDVEQIPIRKGFGEGLLKAGELNKDVVGLCADLTESTQMQLFKGRFPERFVEVGVAEQNLATVASGIASMGKIPFIGSFAIFSPGRNWEQVRTTICYNDQPVKIVGSHAGLSASADGGSHQMLEDIALMRVLPRMVVISPCDAIQAKKATMAIAKTKDPTYLRLTRDRSPVMTTDDTPFEIGKAQIVYRSDVNTKNRSRQPANNSVTIIATGALLYKAIKVAKKISDEGKSVTVLNVHTIKPLDEHMVIKLAHEYGAIVTVEEHQVIGGLGSAISECLSAHFPVPIEFVGVKNRFGQSGRLDELLEYYEIGEKDIYKAVQRVMLRK